MLDDSIRPLDRFASSDDSVLSKQIYSRINEWLKSGRLKEGDPLPSERDLAQMFDVSRMPVREALKVLEFVGIVQHIRGKGVFVKKVSANNIIGTIDFVMMDHTHTIKELFEVREGIETHAAFLAAERRTDEDLATIADSLELLDLRSDPASFPVQPMMEFHSAVIAASHNSALVRINGFLSDWLRFLRTKYMLKTSVGRIGQAEHMKLYELIKARDSAGAAAMMREHLIKAREVVAREAASLDTPISAAMADTGNR